MNTEPLFFANLSIGERTKIENAPSGTMGILICQNDNNLLLHQEGHVVPAIDVIAYAHQMSRQLPYDKTRACVIIRNGEGWHFRPIIEFDKDGNTTKVYHHLSSSTFVACDPNDTDY